MCAGEGAIRIVFLLFQLIVAAGIVGAAITGLNGLINNGNGYDQLKATRKRLDLILKEITPSGHSRVWVITILNAPTCYENDEPNFRKCFPFFFVNLVRFFCSVANFLFYCL